MDTIVTFDSVHQALKCESAFLDASESVILITTPRSVSSSCGFSIELTSFSANQTLQKLKFLNLKFSSLYEKEIKDGVKYYVKKS